jgi:hypothetical protein
MKNDKRDEYLTREAVLKMLSDSEVASVSAAEAAPRLAEGDEYIDLEQLEQGVRRADGANPPMGHVLPRTAVHEDTWRKILNRLPTAHTPTKTAGA